MIENVEMLNLIRQNIQMGIDGIKLVIDDTDSEAFKSELKRQWQEYDDIYSEADNLLEALGGEKQDVNAAVKIATHLSGKMKSMSGSVSKIAESMIQGSTMGVTKLIQHLNDYMGDERIKSIAKRLVETEENNIETLKQYL